MYRFANRYKFTTKTNRLGILLPERIDGAEDEAFVVHLAGVVHGCGHIGIEGVFVGGKGVLYLEPEREAEIGHIAYARLDTVHPFDVVAATVNASDGL